MNDKDFETMFERLKQFRIERKFSQAQLAKMLHIDRTVYCRYENGRREIPVEILWNLADIYETTIDYLIGRTA